MKKGVLICAVLVITILEAGASLRTKYSINENWRFIRQDVSDATQPKCNDAAWQRVDFPHTWNAVDATDDIKGYYRGIGWYRRSIQIPAGYAGKQITIFFEGANQKVELFVNGKSAGTHIGGYTRFSFDITDLIRFGNKNLFSIKVDNSYNPNIPPLSADFTFFGGIYRDVYLIITNKQQISTTHYASEGVYLHTKDIGAKEAEIEIETLLSNATDSDCDLRIEHRLVNPEKKVVQTVTGNIRVRRKQKNIPDFRTVKIKNPELWCPENPALYSIYTRIYDAGTNELLDEIMQPLGLRWFEFSPEKGFILNGKPYKLIGTNRHQCFEGMGNALPDEIHVRDINLLKAMGGNFLRVSHYPQDPVIKEMCDKSGIITSVEIPVVNAITESESFRRNCIEMAKEMVYQDYNRPSITIWAYMNEVLLKPPYKSDLPEYEKYLQSVNSLASQIDRQIREIDPQRYTMISFHGNFDTYHRAGLTEIPMIAGWNLYQGWYGGTFDKFDVFLDETHQKLKEKPFIVTEYGADVDPRLHSFDPVRFDYTQEWANLYHEHYIKAIMERNFVVGAAIWNLNDFYSEERANAMPHVNNKGIVSTSRQVKDTYLQYQAMLAEKPVVNIGGRNWTVRGGVAGENYTCVQPVKIYSNLSETELFLNGFSLGKQKPANGIARFAVPFVNGENTLEAVGNSETRQARDFQRIDFRMISQNLKDQKINFESINVMLGSKRYFEEKDKSIIWIPEKEYSSGSWGYIGGKKYAKQTRHGEQPASDADILNTNIDPVFQTMRRGIKSFKLDVPDGNYTVCLYFAELMSQNTNVSAYNLGNDALADDFEERVFDVTINNDKVISDLNIAQEFGENTAVIKKFIVQVMNGQGITVDFLPVKNETILNAIRVYRNY